MVGADTAEWASKRSKDRYSLLKGPDGVTAREGARRDGREEGWDDARIFKTFAVVESLQMCLRCIQ